MQYHFGGIRYHHDMCYWLRARAVKLVGVCTRFNDDLFDRCIYLPVDNAVRCNLLELNMILARVATTCRGWWGLGPVYYLTKSY